MPIITTIVIYPLLLALVSCPSFSGVNIVTPSNCPTCVCLHACAENPVSFLCCSFA